MHVRVCVLWVVKMASIVWMGHYPFWSCKLASNWRVNLTQKMSSLEHEASVFLQNVMNHLPGDMVSHSRKL